MGLAELLTYLHIAEDDPFASVSEDVKDFVTWNSTNGTIRKARFPRVIFTQRSMNGRL